MTGGRYPASSNGSPDGIVPPNLSSPVGVRRESTASSGNYFFCRFSSLSAALYVVFIYVVVVPEFVASSLYVGHRIHPRSLYNNVVTPSFDASTPTNITVTASKTAMLTCVVRNLGNSSVSWIRNRDLHILTVGASTYTNDERFKVVPPNSQNPGWTLRIQYSHERDSGQYDCQVSSRPPIGKTLHLTVVEPRSRILRAPEMHVGAGSLINLTCVVPYSPDTPEYLHWYHRERMVREDSSRIFIKTHLATRSVSELIVKNANPNDSGIYTCSPAHSREQSVTVHVVTDGYPAAMQGGSSVTLVGHGKLLWLMTIPVAAMIVEHSSKAALYFYNIV